MTTDDERRRVAERLRWLMDSDLPPWVGYTYEAVMGYMLKAGEDSAYHESSYKKYVARLADLIEPSCNREALLALADEMDMDAGCHAYVDDYVVNDYARRIREALGVEHD